MKTVSNDLIEQMQDRTDFYCEASVEFADGTTAQLTREDFSLSENSIITQHDTASFPVGLVVGKRMTISIFNDEDQWADYTFGDAVFTITTKFDLEEGTSIVPESIPMGDFTVIEPESYGDVIQVVAVDDSYKLDTDFNLTLTYPITLGNLFSAICTECDITPASNSFNNDSFIVYYEITASTYRKAIGDIAMLAGGNAIFNADNELEFVAYNPAYITNAPDIDDYDEEGSQLDGYQVLENFSSMKTGTDYVVVTGVNFTDSSGVKHSYGTSGYSITVDNGLIQGREDAAMQLIGQYIVGLKFMPFEGDHTATPIPEFMDFCYVVDRRRRAWKTILTDIDFNYFGLTVLKCSSDSPVRNSSSYYQEQIRQYLEANATYNCFVTSSAGTAFKDKTGYTNLTANIFQSWGDDISALFVIKWFKDSTQVGTGRTITVQASTAFATSDTAVYTFQALNGDNVIKGSAQISLSNVSDGSPGASLYNWVVYANYDSDEGEYINISTSSTGRHYMGVAYNKTTSTPDTTHASLYEWSPLKIVLFTDYYYGISDSSTTPPQSGWTVERPDRELGEWLWMYVETVYSDDTTETSTPVCIQGDPGQGVSFLTPYEINFSTNEATISAQVWNSGVNITTNYPSTNFSWYRRTESGETSLGTGYSITVNLLSFTYGGVVIARFDTVIPEPQEEVVNPGE